jgi:membrane protease YdiL (CAAX protease family)
MSYDDGTQSRLQQRRVPRIAAVLLAAAFVLLVLLPLLPSPYVSGGARLALFLLPLLAFGGTLAALRDRKVGVNSKVVWAVGSALFGLVCVPALFVLVTLIVRRPGAT